MTRRLIIGALAAIAATAAVQAGICGYGAARPDWCRVQYEEAGPNTMVLMTCSCNNGTYPQWYISYFEGHDQPELWDWYDIQNAASELLAGPAD